MKLTPEQEEARKKRIAIIYHRVAEGIAPFVYNGKITEELGEELIKSVIHALARN